MQQSLDFWLLTEDSFELFVISYEMFLMMISQSASLPQCNFSFFCMFFFTSFEHSNTKWYQSLQVDRYENTSFLQLRSFAFGRRTQWQILWFHVCPEKEIWLEKVYSSIDILMHFLYFEELVNLSNFATVIFMVLQVRALGRTGRSSSTWIKETSNKRSTFKKTSNKLSTLKENIK